MFILEGIPAMLLGLLTLRVMTERPADANWLSDDEKRWLESTLAAEREATGGNTPFSAAAGSERHPRMEPRVPVRLRAGRHLRPVPVAAADRQEPRRS